MLTQLNQDEIENQYLILAEGYRPPLLIAVLYCKKTVFCD
jgi:hypothetical protein